MALSLQIISAQREALGAGATIRFNDQGGTIGRGADNDWALPDATRQLSSQHARVHCRDGRYFLEDTSTNGVYAEHGSKLIDRSSLYALRDGEVLRLGDYHVRVRIDEISLPQSLSISHWMSEQDELAATGTLPVVQGTLLNFFGDEDIAPSLLLDDLLACQQQALDEDLLNLPERPPEQAQTLQFEHHKTLQLIDNQLSVNSERHGALQTLCRGAGLDARQLPADAEGRLLLVAGQLLREVIMGVQELRRLQDPAAVQAEPENILATQTMATTEYLQDLLLRHATHEHDAVQRLREVFTSLCTQRTKQLADHAPL
jgi:type VI secretion system FHA domain protein